METPLLSIILPCRNEEAGLGDCLKEIKGVIQKHSLNAEVIVSDSSRDKSPEIARSHNVTLVKHDKEGYGRAILEGVRVASGKYLFIADADGSYDFAELPEFLSHLQNGSDFVIGNRFGEKNIEKNSMPPLHRYLGTPVLSTLLRICTGTKIKDSQCGMRAIRRDIFNSLNLQTTGMEFASEFILEAHRQNIATKEVSIAYRTRKGKSKLLSFRDGWRHLRFMLLYTPTLLFFIPGILLTIAGLSLMLWLYLGSGRIAGIQFFFHPLFFASASLIVGYQLILFGTFAKTFASIQLGHEDKILTKIYRYLTIEKAGVLGLILTLSGIGLFVYIFQKWISTNMQSFSEIRNSIAALTILIIGIQTLFSSFMISILSIRKN